MMKRPKPNAGRSQRITQIDWEKMRKSAGRRFDDADVYFGCVAQAKVSRNVSVMVAVSMARRARERYPVGIDGMVGDGGVEDGMSDIVWMG